MKKVLFPLLLCLLLAGCSNNEVQETAQLKEELKEEPKPQRVVEDVIIHIDPEEATEATETAEVKKPTNNAPEAAEIVDKLFDKDSYHLLVSVNDKLCYEVIATADDKYLDTSYPYLDEDISMLDHHPSYIDKAKGISLSQLTGGQIGAATYTAQATDTSIYEILNGISSSDFSDLVVNDGVVTGKCNLDAFNLDYYASDNRGEITYQGEADVTIDDTITLKNDDVEVTIKELEPTEAMAVPKTAILEYHSASPEMMETTAPSEYDFSSKKPEDYVRWAKYHTGDTDTNGVKFVFTYDHNKYSEPTFENIYLDIDIPYDSFKTLGDFNETARRFEEYRNPNYNKADFEPGELGLPKWYYDKIY